MTAVALAYAALALVIGVALDSERRKALEQEGDASPLYWLVFEAIFWLPLVVLALASVAGDRLRPPDAP